MARKKQPAAATGFVLYDVVYQDGTRSSNRRVPSAEVNSLEGEGAVRAFIEAEDRRIAEMSGNPRGPIKTLIRSPAR